MNNKYYTPTIEEFYAGFEFEVATPENYIDDDEYDLSFQKGEFKWKKEVFLKDKTFSEDVLFEYKWFKNATRYTRVKHLDRTDVESLGFNEWVTSKKPGVVFSQPYNKFTEASCITGTNREGNLYGATIFYGNIHDPNFIRIEGTIAPGPVFGYIGGEPLFKGIIKNKSELKMLLRQLSIIE